DLCFFFQAEDGIRDFHVTGVQTCALPILYQVSPSLIAVTVGVGLAAAVAGALAAVRRVARMPPAQAMRPPAPLSYRKTFLDRLRSEERRVGKGCTIRWQSPPEHTKQRG